MADSDFTRSKETKALIQLLSEIAGDASLVAELCHKACGNNGDPVLDAAAANVAQRIGWLADEGCRRLGDIGAVGGAQEWLLSPRMKDLWETDAPEVH